MGAFVPLRLPDGHFAFRDGGSYDAPTPLLTNDDVEKIIEHKLKPFRAKTWKAAIRRSRRKH